MPFTVHFLQTPKALVKTRRFYNKCKTTRQDYKNQIANGTAIKKIMDNFSIATGLQFSMITAQGEDVVFDLTPTKIGQALGYLSRRGVNTLLTPMVDTDWPNPKNYKFFLDQNTLYYSKSYYKEEAWNTIKDSYKTSVIDLFNSYSRLLSKVSKFLIFYVAYFPFPVYHFHGSQRYFYIFIME